MFRLILSVVCFYFFLSTTSFSQTIGNKTLSKEWKKIVYGYDPDSILIDGLYHLEDEGMYMCSNRGLYHYIDSLYRFKAVVISPSLQGARVSIVMKHLGYYYTGFRDGYGLYRSNDLKKWEPLGSGKLGTSKIFYLYSMDSMLFVCNWQKTIYLSHNLGKTFRSINVGFNTLGKTYISNIVNHEDFMFCSIHGDGIYRLHIRKGKAWEHHDKGLPIDKEYGELAIVDKTLFLGTGDGVYRSDNDASSWKPANIGLENKFITKLVAEGKILYAATNKGELFFSENLGETWKKIPIDFMQSPINGLCVTDLSIFVAVNGEGKKPSYVYYLPFLKKK